MDIQNFREFLKVYNTLTETCFLHCVDTFGDRKLTNHEENCTEYCASKFLNLNRRVMQVYVDVQPKYIRKMEEAITEAQSSKAEIAEVVVTETQSNKTELAEAVK